MLNHSTSSPAGGSGPASSLPTEPVRPGICTRLLASIGGGTPSMLAQHATPGEIGTYVSRGLVSVGSVVCMGAGFSVIANTLFNPDGQWSWPLAALGASGALFMGITDNYCFYRAPQHRQGLKELKKAGLRSVTIPRDASSLVTLFRVGQAIATSAVVALFISMKGYGPDITARIEADYLSENKAIVARVTPVYEASVTRATRAVDEQTALVRALDAQIATLQQNVIRATVRASRNPKSVNATSDNGAAQLAALEAKRTAEHARLDALKTDLDRLNGDRNSIIQQAVDGSPDRRPKRNGFLGKLTAFADILHESWLRIVVVAALEAIAFGIEIAPVLAHWIAVPSGSAAAMALDHLKRVTALARQAAALFEPDDPEPPASSSGDSPKDSQPEPEPPQPESRRKRGRPRKTPLNGHLPPPAF